MQASDRLIVAADLSTRDDVLRLADELSGISGVLKIGLQAFIASGPSLVADLVGRRQRIFLDLKIHDIPNTARHAIDECARLGVAMTTVHASGGRKMLEACARPELLVLGVTVLTSFDEESWREVGFDSQPSDSAVHLAQLSAAAGLRGVVASPQEIRVIREACPNLTIVTPGVRPAGADAGDQARTMTPREAISAGADYVVVGRPITGATDRRSAAKRIVEEMSE